MSRRAPPAGRWLLRAAACLVALAALRGARAEGDPAEARARYLADGDAARLAASLEASGATDVATRTELQLARLAARPASTVEPGEESGYAALPDLVSALRRMDLAAAEAAAARVDGDGRSTIGAWAAALVLVRAGHDEEAASRLCEAVARPLGDAGRAAFSLTLLGAALPEDDRRLLAGAVRASILACGRRGDADRSERLGRLGAALDPDLGVDAVRWAARILVRDGRLPDAEALLAGPEASRLPDPTGALRVERARLAWEAGRGADARALVRDVPEQPGEADLLEALRAATSWPAGVATPRPPLHAEGPSAHAAAVALLAGAMGVRTTPGEVEARALAEGRAVDAPGFGPAFLRSRGLAVVEAAGDVDLAAAALEDGLPFLLYRLVDQEGRYGEAPVLVHARDRATGAWIADDPDVRRPGVLPPGAPAKARLLFAAPADRVAKLRSWRDRGSLEAGSALAAALDLAARGLRDDALGRLGEAETAWPGRAVLALHLARLLHERFLEEKDETALVRAQALVTRSLATPPSLAFEHLVIAQARFFERDVPGALAAFEEARAAQGDGVTLARARFAILLRAARHAAEAIAAVDAALALDPLDTEALYYRGTARARAGQVAAARADLRRALDRRPDSAVIALELVTLELDADRPEIVLQVLDALAARAPDRARDERLVAARLQAEGDLIQRAREVGDLERFTRSPEAQTRRRVAFALAALQNAAAEAVLRRMLDDPEPAVRVTVLRLYMRPWLRALVVGDEVLRGAVLGRLVADDAAVVRGAVAALLGLVEEPFAIEALVGRLAGAGRDPDPYPRAAAAEALARADGPAVRAALVAALEDEDAAVRTAAIAALSRIAGTALGFDPQGAPAARAEALGRWRSWLGETGG